MRWTIDGPDSSYSSLEIHMSAKVESELKMEAPIQTLYLRSGAAWTETRNVDGANAATSD